MNIADAISAQARERPYGVAIVDSGRAFHYRTLDRAVWHAAAWLHREGVRAGDIVAISLSNSALHLVVILALTRIGAVQVGLQQGALPGAVEKQIRQFRYSCVVSDTPLPGQPVRCLSPDPDWLRSNVDAAHDDSLRAVGDDAPWALAVSSGTTGQPKAAVLSHNMGFARFRSDFAIFPFGPGHRYLNLVGLTFNTGRARVVAGLSYGVTIVVPRNEIPETELLELIDRYGVSYLSGTPSHMHVLLPMMLEAGCRFPGLQALRIGAAAVQEKLREDIRARMTPNLYINYGANEVGALTIATPQMQTEFPGTVGRPVPGIELQVVDEGGAPMPADAAGLIRVRGPAVCREYLDAPPTSGTKGFIDGWFYPGDVGSMSVEGMVFLKGRADDLMNFEGVKVAPVEIEDVFLRHPDVAEAAAFAIPSERYQDVPAVAVIVRRPVAPEALIRFCEAYLGPMTPKLILYCQQFPRNAMGKIDRRALLEQLPPEYRTMQ